MRGILGLLHEWLAIRTRVNEEFRFHLEQSEADWRALALSRPEARRASRRRFGGKQNRRQALCELGGDLAGLVALFHAHQLSASAWVRPLAVVAAAALLLAVSPDFRAVLEGIGGQAQTVMPSIPVMGPAKALWACIGFVMSLLLTARFKTRLTAYWFAYGLVLLGLHALASMFAWGVGMQGWSRVHWRTDGTALLAFIALLFVYVGAAAMHCRSWWRDLHRRCPVCLERLRLPLTDGAADRVLLSPISTEWVCIHGHGVLVENRWSRRFRRQESPWEQLIRA
jgi:hypothetical protein